MSGIVNGERAASSLACSSSVKTSSASSSCMLIDMICVNQGVFQTPTIGSLQMSETYCMLRVDTEG